ncbi:hypothetical protein FN846DRAFT_908454 [Sphaerosporella brunnea]|uniref:Uncharacterized protein n=1 Tax=Sphaerosporella brunnea TaxID=1250544 RepID=A0A5J5ETA6_9PEZI|nr:hypothetical protein FN846DRAFT_908454 [Sphaerosporella brunnea]
MSVVHEGVYWLFEHCELDGIYEHPHFVWENRVAKHSFWQGEHTPYPDCFMRGHGLRASAVEMEDPNRTIDPERFLQSKDKAATANRKKAASPTKRGLSGAALGNLTMKRPRLAAQGRSLSEMAPSSTLWIGKAAGWWKKLSTAREALDRRRAEEVDGDISDEDELVCDEADARDMACLPAENELFSNDTEVVEYDEDFADFTGALVDTEGEVVENNDFAALLAKLDVVGNKAEDQSKFQPRAHGLLPAMSAYGGNSSLPPQFIRLASPVNPEDRQRQLQQQDDAVTADQGAQEMATWDKALLGRRTIGWTPGSNEITYGANAICRFDAVCLVSSFAPGMASLLADRDADHPLVLLLCGQSSSGKTWLARKLLEPLEGADIFSTSFEDGAAKRTIPPSDDKRRAVKLTKRLLDELPKWSKTENTAANESSSRAVVGYRMGGLLLIDMPGGEGVGDRPQETIRIKATNTEVLDTLHHFRKTGKVIN